MDCLQLGKATAKQATVPKQQVLQHHKGLCKGHLAANATPSDGPPALALERAPAVLGVKGAVWLVRPAAAAAAATVAAAVCLCMGGEEDRAAKKIV